MADFATSVASNTLGNLAREYTRRHVLYFFCFGKIVEDFRDQSTNLGLAIDRLQNEVIKARSQTQEIEHDVEEWLSKAREELKDVQILLDEIERKKCFSWCPARGWRYCLSKKVAKKTLNVSKLVETCNFPRVGYRAALPGLDFLPSKDFMPSESSDSAFQEIMDALKKDDVTMIGLYGMGGVGKTTLAKEVGKQAKQLFDKVVVVTVSQNPNINNIQDKIADFLYLDFQKKTPEGRAEQLWLRIKDEKSILIILDDVWEELDLKIIGIPFGDDHKGCKIFLTTRLQQVCTRMNSQKEVYLNSLSENEAWALFKDKAGVKDDSPTLIVAEEVARECSGLPYAIVTVAKALKGKSLNGWMAARQRLRDLRPLDNQDVCGGIYSRLKLSYDYLEDDNVKSCFLLCSLFPEDYEISIELLTLCGIGQGLFNNIYFMEDLRREIHRALLELQMSGLLLETNDEESVKMYDVVRDFAHWITSRGENIFMVKDELMTWPMSESFECCTAISLWNIEINHLPNNVEFSKLKTLFLKGKNSLRVSCTFFEKMTTLRVLLLQDFVLTLEALQFLTNLRTLCFKNCELKNISSLRNMENLEIFALLGTNISELPKELAELYKLKSLYFSCNVVAGSYFPPNLLSRLASLQELHVTTENNVNLSELNSLSGLTGLTLRVSTDQCSQESFVFPKLQNYNIAVNEYLEDLAGLSWRTLRIRDFSSSLNAFKELFCNVERLTLSDVTMEHKNIVPNVDQHGLKELTSLELIYCENLECLIDTTREQSPTTAFSNLVNLDITFMISLKELCHGQLPISFLKKLETLCISYCEKLQSVFQMNGLLGKEESQTRMVSNLTSLKLVSLPALESIWKESTHHVSLQSLKEVIIRGCDKLKSIFSPYLSHSLLHLQKLEIFRCQQLEQVFAFDKEMVELETPSLSNLTCLELNSLPELRCIWRGPTHLVNFQSLKIMSIWSCSKLEYLFSSILAQTLVHLEELRIRESNSLKHLISEAENGDEIVSSEDRSRLRWPKLKSLEIASCKSLRYVFPITLAQGLPYLESVQIIDCPQLLHVFNMAKEEDKHNIVLPKLQALRLEDLENFRSFCPRNCSVMWPSFQGLEACNIGNQPQLMTNSQDQQGLTSLFQILKDVRVEFSYDAKSPTLKGVMNQKNLTLKGVMDEKNLVPNVDPKALNELSFLALKDGKDLECLIDTIQDHVSTNAFFNLVELVIQDMTGFKMLCNGKIPKGFLQKLEKLEARNCMEIVSLSPALQDLKEVKVINCGQLQEIFQIDDLHDTEENQWSLLSNLTLMELHSLPELKWIWKGSTKFVSLQSLKFVEICSCNRLKYLFSLSLAQSLMLLEQLKIDNCDGLQHIITDLEFDVGIESKAYPHPPLLPNLETLGISHCLGLEYVFQVPLGQVLPRLKSFWITDSPQLQQVFNVKKEENGVDDDIALPCLRDLRLENLTKLNFFCSENFLITLPSVEKLEVLDCPTLTNFTDQKEVNEQVQLKDFGLHGMKELLCNVKSLTLKGVVYHKNLVPNVDPKGLNKLSFLALKDGKELECLIDTTEGHVSTTALFNLVELVIQDMSSMKMLCNGRFPKGFLQKLEKLEVRNCMEMVSLSPTPQNLKEVKVINSYQLQEIFQIDEFLHDTEENQGSLLSNLTHMALHSLPELKWIWKGFTHFVSLQSLKSVEICSCNRLKYLFSPSLAQSLVLLEELKIDNCNGLQHIITELECDVRIESEAYPHPPLLPKLETLGISHCLRLENVFQVPLGQVLPRLKSFWITDSPQLQQVFNVTKEENGVDGAIALPCLQDLRLENLINLKFFCSENFLITLPSLEKLEVLNCPRLTNFAIQIEVNQQAPLKYLLPALGTTSKERPNHASLQSLKDVTIQKCDRMKSIFSSCCLLHLEQVKISQCNELEQVFAFAQEMNGQEITTLASLTCLELKSLPKLSWIWRGPTHTVNLQNLKSMTIEWCIKLVYLFSPSLAQTLVHLEKLDVQNCNSLEHFIIEAENSDEVVLDKDRNLLWPNLKSLQIAKCKSLKYVFPVTFAQGLPNLESLGITDCPQLMHVFDMAKKMDGHEAKKMDGHDIELPQLKDLSLKKLEKLRSFCPKNYFVKFSSLKGCLQKWN